MRIPDKILIIRFSSLGDVILASPLIRILRSTLPDAEIDFLVKTEHAEIVKFNPHLSSVIELKTDSRDELRALRRQVRSRGYDLILDIHNSLRSRYIRSMSGARSVRVVRKRALARFFLVHAKWNFYRGRKSVAERYLETGSSLGLREDARGLEVFIPDVVASSAAVILSKHHAAHADHILGMVPTARHFTKRWPQERFVAFGVQYAKRHRAKILMFGSEGEKEYCSDIAHLINTETNSAAAESLAGSLTLLETAAVFDRCDLVVTNDTGLMHLAAARGRKVVAIFGSTVGELGFFPYGTESIVVERHDLACRPCTHIGLPDCPLHHFHCMTQIGPEEILSAAEKLIDKIPQAEGINV